MTRTHFTSDLLPPAPSHSPPATVACLAAPPWQLGTSPGCLWELEPHKLKLSGGREVWAEPGRVCRCMLASVSGKGRGRFQGTGVTKRESTWGRERERERERMREGKRERSSFKGQNECQWHPAWCGSVAWALSCKVKGRFPVGAHA